MQGFSPQGVPDDAVTARDSAMLFPWEPCAPGQPASATHQCWEDLRPSGQARACREVPKPKEQSNLILTLTTLKNPNLTHTSPSPSP